MGNRVLRMSSGEPVIWSPEYRAWVVVWNVIYNGPCDDCNNVRMWAIWMPPVWLQNSTHSSVITQGAVSQKPLTGRHPVLFWPEEACELTQVLFLNSTHIHTQLNALKWWAMWILFVSILNGEKKTWKFVFQIKTRRSCAWTVARQFWEPLNYTLVLRACYFCFDLKRELHVVFVILNNMDQKTTFLGTDFVLDYHFNGIYDSWFFPFLNRRNVFFTL